MWRGEAGQRRPQGAEKASPPPALEFPDDQVFGSGNPYKNREGILFEAQISHYINEFDEISRLGKGGYETVYKVRNKLDGQFYAIKKIIIKKATKGDCVKVLREVKVLAGLQHPNIVGYQTAWMEHVQLTCQKGEYSISM